MKKVTLYVTQLEGALNVVQQEYLTMLSEVQKHFRDHPFHGLHKQLCDSMCYLYDDMWITYPHLVTAAHKAAVKARGPTWGGHPSKTTSGRGEG